MAENNTTTTTETADDTRTDSPSRGRRPVVAAILSVVMASGAMLGVRHWTYASKHTSTEDAFVTSDVIQVAPQVSGMVCQVLVRDNQDVRRGELVAVLDDATYQADVAQAQANLDAAVAQAQGAGASVSVTEQTGGAQVEQARGQVAQADSGIAGAGEDVAKAAAAVLTAQATARGAASTVNTLQAGVAVATANQNRAAAAMKASQAQVRSAEAAVRTARANVDAAEANHQRATREAERYASLAAQGAGSRQLAETAETTARSMRAALEAARQQLSAAQATVAARVSDVAAAREAVVAAEAAVRQARAQVNAGRDQTAAALAGVEQARATRAAAQQSVTAANARRQQALAQLHSAQSAPRQLAVSRSARSQALARIEQARAALQRARLQVAYTRIYAPTDGRVSKKTVEVGHMVQPGAPLMVVVPSNRLWVVANLKETQMAGVEPGRPVDIEVDAVPGHPFLSHVESIAPATGATFALLPPDNATGNFTKVVQRIPVKIVLEPGQPGLNRLRAGMSVTATITTR